MLGGPRTRSSFPPPSGSFTPPRCGLVLLRRSQLGVDGSLTFSLEPAADETQVTLTYAVGGYYPGGLDTLAAPVDSVLKGQLASLKSFVEE